ncbi:two-component regulator propeller domain-containing protein [Spirosoma areae]
MKVPGSFARSLLIHYLFVLPFMTQGNNVPFKHLTEANGLPDPTVRCFTQDRYGFIWMGTDNGLCRFDGRVVRTFVNVRHQPTSLPHNGVAALYTDSDGYIWAGSPQFIARFDYTSQSFQQFPLPNGARANSFIEDSTGTLWIATEKGMLYFNRRAMRFTSGPLRDPSQRQKLANCRVLQLRTNDRGTIFVATDKGLKCILAGRQTVDEFHHDPANPESISDEYVTALAPDGHGGVWLGVDYGKGLLEHLTLRTGRVKKVNMRQFRGYQPQSTAINDIQVEPDGRIWVAAHRIGLIHLNAHTLHGEQYQPDPFIPSSLRGQHILALFKDRQGLIWLGTENLGVNWFNPSRPLFTRFGETQDAQTSLPSHWARTALEDKRGNLWLGTANGLVAYQTGKGFVQRFTSTDSFLPFYSIRSLAEDGSGAIWIGTGKGINRYLPATNRLESYPEPDPGGGGFYRDLLVSRQGTVWAASTGGLRRYNARLDRFELLTTDSLFGSYAKLHVRFIAEDTTGGLWIGTHGEGLLYWNPARKIIRHYRHQPGNRQSLVDNYVTSIAIENAGRVWIATLNGLCTFEESTQTFRSVDHLFRTTQFGSLLIDTHNRIWTGTNAGLYCLDADRQTTHRFDEGDGLPSNKVSDQRACRLRDGRFCYATLQGFALFRPEMLLATPPGPGPVSYLTNFSVFDQPHPLPRNPEATTAVSLRADENFFTFEWATLHYNNPEKCRYAYRLVGFDRDWVYPNEPIAQYTNVPGGDYDFEFRSSLTPGRWDGPVRHVHVHLATVLYKKGWFISLIGLLVLGIAVGFYQYRMQQTIRMARLKMRATRLEKDNALVQYQNLINQLNPHFLFNSLAVLDGLITKDGKLARRYLSRLTKVYRYLIENERIEVVPLEREVKFLTDFVSLLTTRYGGGFQAEILIPEPMLQRKIVPATLQNLIENALKHNTTDEESPLRVGIRVLDDHLLVENNVQKRSVVTTSNRKGLDNLKRLYRYLTNRPLRTEETDDHFTVYIPLLDK